MREITKNIRIRMSCLRLAYRIKEVTDVGTISGLSLAIMTFLLRGNADLGIITESFFFAATNITISLLALSCIMAVMMQAILTNEKNRDAIINNTLKNMYRFVCSIYNEEKSKQVMIFLCEMLAKAVPEETELGIICRAKFTDSEEKTIQNGGELVTYLVTSLMTKSSLKHALKPKGKEILNMLYEEIVAQPNH